MSITSAKARGHQWDSVFLPEIEAASWHQGDMGKYSGLNLVIT